MQVPFFDLQEQHDNLKYEIEKNIATVLTSGKFILGPQVEKFEASFANYIGTTYSIGVSSGTDALYLALSALGVGPGDEVIIPAHTFVATPIAAIRCGASPVLVDVNPDSCLIDLEKIEAAISPKTKVICPVHLYGRVCNMEGISELAKRYSLYVVEDSSQAHGAYWNDRRAGVFGDLGCFSFYPSKNLGAYGDGGAVVTSSRDLYEKVRQLRNYGAERKYCYNVIGSNSRLDEIQAAILIAKLPYLEEWNYKRWEAAKKYHELLYSLCELGDIKLPELKTVKENVFHLYPIQLKKRDAAQKVLEKSGIQTAIHYPRPFYLEPGFKHFGYKEGSFPVAERIAKEIISLPMFPEINQSQLNYVSKIVRKFVLS